MNPEKIIPVAEPLIEEEEMESVADALKSGWISSNGRFIDEFEDKFSKYCGVKYGVVTFNGTVALHLALKSLGISEGDEIIMPTLTFVATANAARYADAKPVFVDSHPDYWCIDPEKIEEKITKKTKAIIPVHLYGHPCDMGPIIELAEKYNLKVIEDCAEAHGAEYKGKKVGSFGDISCFSFYGNKIITTGEGGICITNDEALSENMRMLKNHGMNPKKKYWHDVIGFNYRMTNIQAAIGLAQLKKIERFIDIKRKNAKIYNSLLNAEGITLPPEEKWAKNVYWMYSVLVNEKFKISRDQLAERLDKNNIETRPFFYPVHILPPYKTCEGFPVTERLSKDGLNLPSSVKLKEEDIRKVTNIVIA